MHTESDMEDMDLKVDLNTVPVRVINVKLEGLGRTKNDYVNTALQDVFKAHNFSELINHVGIAQSKLKKLEAFSEVGSVVDTSKEPNAPNDAYEVTFIVKEMKRYGGAMNTSFGSNEASLKISLRSPNLFGRGEKITAEYLLNSTSENSSEIKFYKPISSARQSNIVTSIFVAKTKHELSGFNYFSYGSLFGFNFKPAATESCQVQWQGDWRQIINTPEAKNDVPVLLNNGHSVKSALKFIFSSDKRDQRLLPNSGGAMKYTTELAGLLGDAKFWKNDLELQYNQPLFKGIVLQSSLQGGFLQPFNSSIASCNIYDRFFLGGPNSLRGFALRGVGPRDNHHHSLGAKAYWSAAVHLYSPLPFSVGKLSISNAVKMHAFMNAGNLSNSLFTDKWTEIRMAYGLGLAVRIGQSAKLEFNYCWPWRFTKRDKPVEGLQFGIGIDFV